MTSPIGLMDKPVASTSATDSIFSGESYVSVKEYVRLFILVIQSLRYVS